MNRLKTITSIIICLAFQEVQATNDIHALSQTRLYAQKLYYHGAMHWAIDTLNKKLAEIDENDSSNWLELGNTHQLLSHIYSDAGYIMQGKEALERMWYYKSKITEDNDIYFVEYTSYKTRYLASSHNYAPAWKMMDSAAILLETIKHKSNKIDTLFFRVNQLNLLRNKGSLFTQNTQYKYKLNLVHEYEKMDFKSQMDPFKRALYYRYLGNFWQDLTRIHPVFTENERTFALKKCIYYYSIGRQVIIDSLGYPNEMATLFSMLSGLQFTKFLNFRSADSVYEVCNNELSVKIKEATIYRSLQQTAFCNNWKSQAQNLSLDTSGLNETYLRLKSEWRIIRLFNSKYLEASPNILKDAFTMHPASEMTKIAGKMAVKSDNKELWNQRFWDNVNIINGKSAYYESVIRTVGKKPYLKASKTLDSIEFLIRIATDKLFLKRKNSSLVNQFDSTNIRTEITLLDALFYDNFYEQNEVVRRFMKGESAIDLTKYSLSLKDDQATLIYFLNDYQKENVLLIKKGKSQVIEYDNQKFSDSTYQLIDGSKSFHSEKLINNKAPLELYSNYFKPVDSFLSEIKRIKIVSTNSTVALSFSLLLKESLNNNFQKSDYLLNKYAFSYSRNLNTDWINDHSYPSNLAKKAVLFGNCSNTAGKNQTTPFSERLCYNLATNWATTVTSQKSQLTEKQYSILHIAAHGNHSKVLDSSDFLNQNNVNQNSIYLCDGPFSINELDSANYRANLVILSSCETDDGYLDRADGRFNFTRMFLKNGSHCVLSSTIPLDDKTTSYILERFYIYFEEGDYASVALQKSKLDFLNTIEDPELYHPKYWSGLMVFGNDIRIKQNSFWEKWWGYTLVLGILMLTGLGITFRQFNKDQL